MVYTQNPVGSGQDVLVPGAVSIDRGFNNRLYNGVKETFHNATQPHRYRMGNGNAGCNC